MYCFCSILILWVPNKNTKFQRENISLACTKRIYYSMGAVNFALYCTHIYTPFECSYNLHLCLVCMCSVQFAVFCVCNVQCISDGVVLRGSA